MANHGSRNDTSTPNTRGAPAAATSRTEEPVRSSPRVFIVVPAYNEGAAIATVVREIRSQYPNVVVVDDGSTDDTFDIAKTVAPIVLRHIINRGQGAALQTGITVALKRGADIIVMFDADGQHRVEDIEALTQPIRDGACDITLGSRFLGQASGMPARRRFTLKLGVWFTRTVNRVKLTDTHNGFRAFSRRAAQRINITQDRMAHASELIDQIRNSELPYREVPVQIRYTAYSLAKGQSSRSALRIVFHYLVGRVFE